MRKRVATTVYAMIAAAFGLAGCDRGPAGQAAADANIVSTGIDETAENMSIGTEDLTDLNNTEMNSASVDYNDAGDDPGPPSQSGSEPDHSRPKNKMAGQ